MPLTQSAVDEINRLVEESRKGDFLVRNVQHIFEVLKKHSLIQRMRIPPKAVGVHPANRDGACIVTQHVHELLDNISAVGFEPSRTNPIAIEASTIEQQTFNKKLIDSAGGQLGKMELGELKILSLSSSHTNFALRLVADSAPHISESIAVNGCLSLEMVQKRDKVLADHVLQGLEWTVLSSEVGATWPDLLLMVQSSANATLQKSESELQLLRRVCTILSRQSTPDYQLVKKQALSSKPPCAESLPGLFQFALRHCGGKEAFFLAETEGFLRSHGQMKAMGPNFWEQLSMDMKKGGEQVTFFRHAIVKLALSTSLVTATSVKRVFGKESLPKAIEADQAMSKIRGILQGAGVDSMHDPRMMNLLGVTDCTMAKLVLGLHTEGDKKYKSVAAVAHDCIMLANGLLRMTLQSPWEANAEAHEEQGSKESSVHERLRELNPDGSLKNPVELLTAEGFIVGAFIKRKGEKFEGQISAMDNSNVTVKDLKSGGVLQVQARDMLGAGWIVFTPKAEAESIASLQSMGPKKNNDFLAGYVIGEIYQVMHDLVSTHESHKVLGGLSLQLKPNRALISNQVFPKGKMVLVPYSWRVLTRNPKGEAMANAVQVQTKWKLDDREFWIASSNTLPKDTAPEEGKHFLSAYFLVGSCEDEESANMVQIMSGTAQSSIRIPMFKNSKEICIGAALNFLKVKQVEADEHAPKAKKAKTSKK